MPCGCSSRQPRASPTREKTKERSVDLAGVIEHEPSVHMHKAKAMRLGLQAGSLATDSITTLAATMKAVNHQVSDGQLIWPHMAVWRERRCDYMFPVACRSSLVVSKSSLLFRTSCILFLSFPPPPNTRQQQHPLFPFFALQLSLLLLHSCFSFLSTGTPLHSSSCLVFFCFRTSSLAQSPHYYSVCSFCFHWDCSFLIRLLIMYPLVNFIVSMG